MAARNRKVKPPRDPVPQIGSEQVLPLQEVRHLDAERVRVDEAGRIVVPSRFRKAIGLKAGDELTVTLRGDVLQARSVESARRYAQALVKQRVKPGRSLVDELIAERREEARRE